MANKSSMRNRLLSFIAFLLTVALFSSCEAQSNPEPSVAEEGNERAQSESTNPNPSSIPDPPSLGPITGDFFGDGLIDKAVLETDSSGLKMLVVYNGIESGIARVEVNEFSEDYSWVGVFESVAAGEALWSNWDDSKEEGLRGFEDVPENEIVKLNHEAIFVHYAESCGGGFIFWQNDKWNWLQQE